MLSVYGCKTKKDLVARVGEDAREVLQETSFFGIETKPGCTVNVVGPAPTLRKWYANVTIGPDYRIMAVK